MASEERAFLEKAGNLITIGLVGLSVIGVFSGVIVGVGVLLLSHFWEHGIRSGFRKFMLASAILVCLMSLTEFSCWSRFISVVIRVVIIKGESKTVLDDGIAPYEFSINVLEFFMLLIADFIVLWRAWALYTRQTWVLVLPCLTYLGSLASALAYTVLGSNPIVFSWERSPSRCKR